MYDTRRSKETLADNPLGRLVYGSNGCSRYQDRYELYQSKGPMLASQSNHLVDCTSFSALRMMYAPVSKAALSAAK